MIDPESDPGYAMKPQVMNSDHPIFPGTCAQCGKPMPMGNGSVSCPACLFRGLSVVAGAPLDSAALAESRPLPPFSSEAWQPPSPEELQAQIPRFKVIESLGHGQVGVTYKGWQASLDRHVAIKILPFGVGGGDPAHLQRFRNEARAMARLNHSGIVAVYDSGETAGGLDPPSIRPFY